MMNFKTFGKSKAIYLFIIIIIIIIVIIIIIIMWNILSCSSLIWNNYKLCVGWSHQKM